MYCCTVYLLMDYETDILNLVSAITQFRYLIALWETKGFAISVCESEIWVEIIWFLVLSRGVQWGKPTLYLKCTVSYYKTRSTLPGAPIFNLMATHFSHTNSPTHFQLVWVDIYESMLIISCYVQWIKVRCFFLYLFAVNLYFCWVGFF